jgi:hypothetical protein
MFAPQTIWYDCDFILLRAGISILANTPRIAIMTRQTPGSTIPVMAMALPFKRPLLLPILISAIIPQMIAGRTVRKKVKNDNIARMIAAIAQPEFLASSAGEFGCEPASTQLQF